jgi:hypothetical protein
VGLGPDARENPTRQLIRISSNKTGCTILFMPFSEFHDFRLTANGTLPEKVISTSTSATVNDERGAYYFEREYMLNTRTGLYRKKPSSYKIKVGFPGREKADCDVQ